MSREVMEQALDCLTGKSDTDIAHQAAIKALRAQLAKPPSFSDFIRNATPEEKAEVYEQVMEEASREQAAMVGWQLVPVEPTDEMLRACLYEDRKHLAEYNAQTAQWLGTPSQTHYWKAMLKAAPKPEQH